MTSVIADPAASWELRRQLALTLGRIGAPAASAVPTFRALLHNTELDPVATRLWSLKALGLMGTPAAESTEEVSAFVLDQRSPFLIRATAMETLARVGTGREVTLRALVRVLQEDLLPGEHNGTIDELRMIAAEAVSLLGPEGLAALPELLRATRSEWALLRRSAAMAIGKLGPQAAVAVRPLGELAVFDDAGEVREAAVDSLAQLGAEGVAELAALFRSQDVPVRLLAVRGLRGVQGNSLEPPLAVLRTGLTDAQDVVRGSCAEALLSRNPLESAAVSVLVGLLNSADRSARKLAYETLRDGPQENLKPHRERLEQLRTDPQSPPQVVTAAQGLLRRLEEN